MAQIVDHPGNRHHRVRAVARSVSWQVRKRVARGPIEIDYAGFRLRCWRDSNSASNIFYFSPKYDFHEMTFLERYLRPGDRALDIGANIGTYSLLMASLVGPEGHVDAFEPMPLNAERLRDTVARNHLERRITVHEAAVADEAGTARFLTSYDVSNRILLEQVEGEPVVEVATVALDDAIVPGPDLRVAKIDVEGAELLALRGAAQLLTAATPPVWISELFNGQLTQMGASAQAVVDEFAAAGFEPMRFDADDAVLHPVDEPGLQNVLFVHRDHLDEVRERISSNP